MIWVARFSNVSVMHARSYCCFYCQIHNRYEKLRLFYLFLQNLKSHVYGEQVYFEIFFFLHCINFYLWYITPHRHIGMYREHKSLHSSSTKTILLYYCDYYFHEPSMWGLYVLDNMWKVVRGTNTVDYNPKNFNLVKKV